MSTAEDEEVAAPTLSRKGGAQFSACGLFRYSLWRTFAAPLGDRGALCFVLLNPSTADAETNDPTVQRCENRAFEGGYSGVVVVNLFALRATDPKTLYEAAGRIGNDSTNDAAILRAASESSLVVCGWGEHGSFCNRGRIVAEMLRESGVLLSALALNKGGEPRHPLYVSYQSRPRRWVDNHLGEYA